MAQEAPARTKIPANPHSRPREEQGRWRAVWYENGERQQCEAASEEKLAA